MAANKGLYILDASVIVKWYTEENEEKEQALMLKNDYLDKKIECAIFHYVHAEVLNFLGRNFSQDRAMALFSAFLTFEMDDYPITLELASVAVELMKKFPKISFYDAGYHALAIQHGGTFITSDARYFSKAHKAGHIMLLKDYGKSR